MREDLDRLRFAVRAAAARCRRGGDLDVTLRRGVRKAGTKWTTALSAAEVSPGSKELHALRIATKRLRYRIEVAADAGEPRAERTLPWLEALQEVIGRWHDEKILREMTDDDVPPLEPRAALFSAPHGAARKELECWLAAS